MNVSAAGIRAIEDHVRLLLVWNQAMNLTAITEPGAVARLHVADSLAGVAVLREGHHATVLDLGSGGGFPGLPIAAALPSARVTLVDSVGKKARFLTAAVEITGLGARVAVLCARAATLAPGGWDVVTARAVGGLADLVELALPLLAPGGRLVAWKRGDLTLELAAAARVAQQLGGSAPAWRPHPDDLGRAAELGGHGVVVIGKEGPTPAGYPREPATRRGRPI